MLKYIIFTFIILSQFSFWVYAQISESGMIHDVPDYSQPPNTTLPSTKIDSTNYCAPFAYLNIIDYWENVYLHRNAQGMMGGLPALQTVEYIGWFLDTNDQGDPTRMNGTDPVNYPSRPGTYTIDEVQGISNYVNFDVANPLGFPFVVPPLKVASPWLVPPDPHPEDFLIFQDNINIGHPVKLDFLYWNPIPTGDSIIIETDTVYIYRWGPQIANTAGLENTPWEEWNLEMDPLRNIGHAVTGVGYILDTLEYAIVHDNWSTTHKHIAIPWRKIPGLPYVTSMIMVTPPPALLKVHIPDTNAYTASQISVPITVEDLSGLHVRSYHAIISFNQSLLEVVGASSVNTLSASWGAPTVYLDTPSPGQMVVDGAGSTELSGAGNLVYLQFNITGSIGDTTQLSLSTMQFNIGDPAADTSSGSLAIIPREVNVSFESNPVGCQISVDYNSFTSPISRTWSEGDTHIFSAPSPQIGGTGLRYIFHYWSNGGSQQQTFTVPANDTSFTAYFHTEYELTTAVNPPGSGTISLNPPQNWFREDSLVVLTAIPDSGYQFNNWMGDMSGLKNPDTLLMDNRKSITANFNIINGLITGNLNNIPKAFALKQNYPNPFNPSTMVSFDLPEASEVTLRIFNILGEEVAILVKEKLSAGTYHYIWAAPNGPAARGAGMASGMYIYQLQAGDYVENRKMILMR